MAGSMKQSWSHRKEYNQWIKNVSAGGCRNFIQTFAMNPQFHVEVTKPDANEKEGLLVVGLMQRDDRKKRRDTGADLLSIGYMIYEGTDAKGVLDKRYFETHRSVAKTEYINLREVTGRHKLKPGLYVIVPSTYEAGNEGEFLLRIFSEKQQHMEERDEVSSISDVDTTVTDKQSETETAMIARVWPYLSGKDQEINAFELCDLINMAYTGQIPEKLNAHAPREMLGQFEILRKKVFENIGSSTGGRGIKFRPATVEACRTFIALFDFNSNGKMGMPEFVELWKLFSYWKVIYVQFDQDKSGMLSCYEMRDALAAIGFKLSNRNFNSVMQRYTNREGSIELEDFLVCASRLRIAFHTYDTAPKTPDQRSVVGMEEFVQTMIYS